MDATIDLIDRCMASAPAGSLVLTITPEVAAAILAKYNTSNRGLKPHKIRPLVGDIRRGLWLVTGETLKFSDRRLLDGQNRLTACVESGYPIKTHVVFGIDDDAFTLIDTGAPRTPGDVLVCAGIKNPIIISHAVSRLNTWDQSGGQRSTLYLSPNQVLTLYETKYSDLQDHITWGRQLQAARGHATSWGTTLHYAFTKAAGHELADGFFRAWIDADPAVQQTNILRRRVDQLRTMHAGQIRAYVFYAMALKAWAFYVDNKSIDVNQIRWDESEPFPSVRRPRGKHEQAAESSDQGPEDRVRASSGARSSPITVAG